MPDWFCNKCKFNVFGSKDSCKCGNTRTNNQHKPVQAKTNANDWWCNTCKFNVFGSKTSCSKCKISKIDNSNRDNNLCAICDSANSQKKVLNYGHIMCSECLDKIKRLTGNCPFCKVKITTSMTIYC